MLRRTARDSLEEASTELSYAGISVDLGLRTASVEATPVQLTPTEFRLLVLLMREPLRTFTRDQIIDRVFGYDFEGFDRTVDSHIYSLRRKLEGAAGNRRYIHTVYGVGYRLGDA